MSQYFEQDCKVISDKRFHRASMIHDTKQLYELSFKAISPIQVTNNKVGSKSITVSTSVRGEEESKMSSHYCDQMQGLKCNDKKSQNKISND